MVNIADVSEEGIGLVLQSLSDRKTAQTATAGRHFGPKEGVRKFLGNGSFSNTSPLRECAVSKNNAVVFNAYLFILL
jgi:hypothetical protein